MNQHLLERVGSWGKLKGSRGLHMGRILRREQQLPKGFGPLRPRTHTHTHTHNIHACYRAPNYSTACSQSVRSESVKSLILNRVLPYFDVRSSFLQDKFCAFCCSYVHSLCMHVPAAGRCCPPPVSDICGDTVGNAILLKNCFQAHQNLQQIRH